MISTADALEIMTVVAACHHRTAQRLDDREAALATANIWRDLFNEWRLELPDLVAAVKKRAARVPEAPEPAEIITYAREIRRDRTDRESDAERDARAARQELKVMPDEQVLRQIARRTGQRAPGREIAS